MIVYWLSLFLCPKIPQKRLVSASGSAVLAACHNSHKSVAAELRIQMESSKETRRSSVEGEGMEVNHT